MNLLDEPQSSRPNTLRHSLSDRNKLIQIKPSWQISQNQGVNHNKNKKKCIEPCGDCERSCWKSSASWELAQKTRQYKEDCWPGIYWSVSQRASQLCARGQGSNTAHSTRTRIVHSFTFQPFSPHCRHKNITGFNKNIWVWSREIVL